MAVRARSAKRQAVMRPVYAIRSIRHSAPADGVIEAPTQTAALLAPYLDEAGKPTDKVYRYLLLYTVPRAQIDAAIQRALDAQSGKAKPKTEEEQTARDRVKELFSEGM